MAMQLGEAAGLAPVVSHFSHNKLGGLPDWPPSFQNNFNLQCKRCRVSRPLIVQCYAPLEKSPYHRILYVFACINPQCWNKPDSWSCIRVQFKEIQDVKNEPRIVFKPVHDDWCNNADDWGIQNVYDNDESEGSMAKNDSLDVDMEEVILATENMSCSNVTSRLQELKEKIYATAEIEVDDQPNTSIDKPISSQCDVNAILQEKPDIPKILKENNKAVINFMCEYITVYEEELSYKNDDSHIKELLQRYESENVNDVNALKSKGTKKLNDGCENEEYEKVIPLHGDIYFHSFLNKIKMNPKQIIRYGLGNQPLLISPFISDLNQQKCANCSGKVQFEFQILPTIIPLLKLPESSETHLEFGTVIIFTCKNSCWKENDSFVYETVLLQQEP